MKNDNFDTVYVGLSIARNTELLQVQNQICSIQKLTPRPEFHVTIAYFGEVSPSDVNRLGNSLSALMSENLYKLQITGLGGAYQDNSGKVHTINSLTDVSHQEFPRVFWWSISLTNAMIDFRNSLISTAISLGLPKTYLRPTFCPHVTVGSGGPGIDQTPWCLWDVHTIAKEKTVIGESYPNEFQVERIHVTSVPVHPGSLFVIGQPSRIP